MTVFTQNLKRFRLARKLTQDQAAEALGVSTQTVSRWECNTTLPDVTMLPKIAVLYGITVDDLYQETSTVYENYAGRLLSVFEATHKPDDFMQAELEYRKLLKSGNYTANDLRSCGILHQYMMQVCRDKAEECFDRVLMKGPGENPEIYWSTRRQKAYFLWEIGRNQENIQECLPPVEAGSHELQEWICLIQAYSFAQAYDTALEWAKKAEELFPESAMLHIYTGDLLRAMKRHEEAFPHWNRALELEPQWCDAAYSMASCYEELGDYAAAYDVYTRIADDLERGGFDAEVALPRTLANRCREKITK